MIPIFIAAAVAWVVLNKGKCTICGSSAPAAMLSSGVNIGARTDLPPAGAEVVVSPGPTSVSGLVATSIGTGAPVEIAPNVFIPAGSSVLTPAAEQVSASGVSGTWAPIYNAEGARVGTSFTPLA